LSRARRAGPVIPLASLRAASYSTGQGDFMTIAAILVLAGRAILGLFFVIAGIRNFAHFSQRLETAKTNYGWKMPAPVLAIGFLMQLLGGFSVLFGVWTVWGALDLIVFLVVATSLFHNCLMFSGKERDPHLYLSLVNTALAGFCLMVIGLAL
jgi:putative oxidoreductase